MGVQDKHQRWAFLHNAHSRVRMAVDASLVTFGLPKPTFQVEIVLGPIRSVVPHEQPRLKTRHHFSQVLLVPILTGLVLGSQGCELLLTLDTRTVHDIECSRYFGHFLDLLADRFLRRSHGLQTAFDALGQTL
jgi:hypothetical protein